MRPSRARSIAPSMINDLIQNNSLTIGKLSAKAVYHSSKIPFAFDYRGSDTNVAGHYHGTHVAGIVGANSGDTVTGVAPDAQFFIMKVFEDEGPGAYGDDILAALDDSAKLGADSINMSLGSAAGFTTASTKAMNAVYQRVKEAGINLLCAAGNDYSAPPATACPIPPIRITALWALPLPMSPPCLWPASIMRRAPIRSSW